MSRQKRYFWKGYYKNHLTYSPHYNDKKDFLAFGKPTKFDDLIPIYGSKRMTGYFENVNGEKGVTWAHVVLNDFFSPRLWSEKDWKNCRKFHYEDALNLTSPALQSLLTTCETCRKKNTTTLDRPFLPMEYLRHLELSADNVRLCDETCLAKFCFLDAIFAMKFSTFSGVPFVGNPETASTLKNETQLKRLVKKAKMAAGRWKHRTEAEFLEDPGWKSDLKSVLDLTGALPVDLFLVDPALKDYFLNAVCRLPCFVELEDDDLLEFLLQSDHSVDVDFYSSSGEMCDSSTSDRSLYDNFINRNDKKEYGAEKSIFDNKDEHVQALKRKFKENRDEFLDLCSETFAELKPVLFL